MVGVASASGLEEAVVGIEHFATEELEPFPSDSSSIFSLLVFELYFQSSLEHLGLIMHDISKTVFEYLFSADVHVHHVILCFLPQPLQLGLED